jgi:LDH2 family malate/lactate/ureidoglycolate dehydrogenase
VVLDIATSVASNGVIRTHELQGKPLPAGWVQSRQEGAPITDPRAASDGTYLPIGAHKGSGLALVIGLLAGPLNGAAFGREIPDFAAASRSELNVGQFVVALDVARFVPLDVFKAAIDRHVRELASSRPRPGVDAVRVPGQGRHARRRERAAHGIPLDAALVAQLHGLAQSLAITPLSART